LLELSFGPLRLFIVIENFEGGIARRSPTGLGPADVQRIANHRIGRERGDERRHRLRLAGQHRGKSDVDVQAGIAEFLDGTDAIGN
jgi:hypothetical protein